MFRCKMPSPKRGVVSTGSWEGRWLQHKRAREYGRQKKLILPWKSACFTHRSELSDCRTSRSVQGSDSSRKTCSHCLPGQAERKAFAQPSQDSFEKLISYPVIKSLKQTSPCAAQPAEHGLVFPMPSPTWLGAVLILGVQLRGKETWHCGLCCHLDFPLLIP